LVKKIENRGGARPGTGPKPQPKPNYDEKFKKNVLAAVSRLEKKHQKKFLDAILEQVYDDKAQASVKASIFKAYIDIFTVKQTESKSERHDWKHQGPAIMLPEMDEDPALKVVKGGKK
jgi:hypothetical protein